MGLGKFTQILIVLLVSKFIIWRPDLDFSPNVPVVGKFTHDNSDLTLGKFTQIKFILVVGKFIIWGPGKYTQIWIVPRMFQE